MKSKAAIQIEFQQVINQARELEDCADELQQIQRQIESLVDNLRSGWAGESAELYFEKCGLLSNKLATSQRNLDQTANVIRRSARIYRDAELAAIQLTQT